MVSSLNKRQTLVNLGSYLLPGYCLWLYVPNFQAQPGLWYSFMLKHIYKLLSKLPSNLYGVRGSFRVVQPVQPHSVPALQGASQQWCRTEWEKQGAQNFHVTQGAAEIWEPKVCHWQLLLWIFVAPKIRSGEPLAGSQTSPFGPWGHFGQVIGNGRAWSKGWGLAKAV